MAGRRASPALVVAKNNHKQHDTKKTLAARKNGEPKTVSESMECPKRMTKEAQEEWKTLVALFKELSESLLGDLDRNALEIYCEAMVGYRKAMDKVHETSEVYKFRDELRINPWLKVAGDASAVVKKYGEMLLLDPVSRARVGLARSKEEELTPLANFLKNKGGVYAKQS
jgi:P27 family predicted phage terminase small subunit